MSQLPTLEAPERGMESLLAYAEQAARRARSGPAGAPTWWSRLLVPAASALALAAVVVVGIRVTRQVNLSPAADGERSVEVALRSPAELKIKAAEEPQRKPSVATSPAKGAKEDKSEVTKAFGSYPPSYEASDRRDSFGAGAKLRQTASARELDSQRTANKDLAETESSAEGRLQQSGVAKQSAPSGAARSEAVTLGGTLPKPSIDAVEERKPAEPSVAPAQRKASSKKQIAQSERLGARGGVEGGVVGGVLAGSPMGIVNGAPSRSTQQEKVAATGEAMQGIAGGGSRTVAELSDEAAKAKDDGDRRREVAQLRQALADAQGEQRAELLYRLWDALDALGQRAEATATYDQLLREFPHSEQAATAMRRKNEDEVRAKAKAAPAAPADALKAKRQPSN